MMDVRYTMHPFFQEGGCVLLFLHSKILVECESYLEMGGAMEFLGGVNTFLVKV